MSKTFVIDCPECETNVRAEVLAKKQGRGESTSEERE